MNRLYKTWNWASHRLYFVSYTDSDRIGLLLSLVETLETHRSKLIGEVIGVCQEWFDNFGGAYSCTEESGQSFACGSMLLGALTRQLNNIGILSPKPAAPYSGFSLEGLQRHIQSIKTPTWYFQNGYSGFIADYKEYSCSLDPVIQEVNRVVDGARGLVLSDFVDRAESAIDIIRLQG
jgi:hypothetical protein